MENKSILLVDDEINILNALKRGLINENIKCLIATDGSKALEIMEDNDIAVIVTDMRMPGMNGLQLLKTIKEKYPNTVRIVLSGYAQLPQIISTINQVDVFKFILKPWDMENEFINNIREALDYHSFLIERESTIKSQAKRYYLYLNILKSTDEKFAKYDEELSNIKLVSQQAMELMKDFIVSQSNEDNDDIMKSSLLNQIYKDYLNAIRPNNTYFMAQNLIDSFNNLNLDKDYEMKLKLNVDINDNLKINGNLEFVLVIMSAIVKLSLYCKDIDNSSIIFTMEKNSVIIEIKNYHNFNKYIDDYKNKFTNIIGEIMPILYNMCCIMNCDIMKQETIEAINIKLILK